MSVLNDLLDTVRAGVAGLGISVNGIVTNAVVGKLPKKEQNVDTPQQVNVSGAERVDSLRRIGFKSCWQVIYDIQITLITPTERDAVFGLTDHAAWREAVRAYFQSPNAFALAEVKRVEFTDSPFMDREELSEGYDYDQLTLRITTYERRP